ncbi:MAG: response regulator, partial [Bacteroidota bacterium]
MKENINVLIIDDNEIDRVIAVSNLRHIFDHINVFESRNGLEALNFLGTAQMPILHLILVDINMPIMNGFKFLERYEALYLQNFPQALVYLISSSSDPADIAKAKKFHSVTDFFIKPFNQLRAQNLRQTLFDSLESKV